MSELDAIAEAMAAAAARGLERRERREARRPRRMQKALTQIDAPAVLEVTCISALPEPLYLGKCACGTRVELTRAEVVLRRELRAGCGRAACPHTPPLYVSLATPEAVLTGIYFAMIRQDPYKVDPRWGGRFGGVRGVGLVEGLEAFIQSWEFQPGGKWDVFPMRAPNAPFWGPETVQFSYAGHRLRAARLDTEVVIGMSSLPSTQMIKLFGVDKVDFLRLLYQGLSDTQIVINLCEA